MPTLPYSRTLALNIMHEYGVVEAIDNAIALVNTDVKVRRGPKAK